MAAIAIPTYLSYVNRAKDSEASTNLGAIFTDETAFNATNSTYINAGYVEYSVAPGAKATATHPFYAVGATYDVDTPPYQCNGNVLQTYGGYTPFKNGAAGTVVANGTTLTTALGGFGDIGFLPKGTLYFYYVVTTSATASTTIPAGGLKTAPTANPANGTCGAGYEAEAWSNFTGSNLQGYAVNDYSTSANLIAGTAY